ncbi:MAG: DNA replication/repair protein RecF, partial [Deltaproteobacteria bacterium]|nr:DNA replication/repair protein RecF [Deltaproteobacteria bacterium]
MFIKKFGLSRFRNITESVFSFHPRFNIFVGQNGQGKTNFLEAIYLLAFGKSFRVQDFRDLIGWGSSEALVRAWVDNGIGDEERGLRLTQEKKSAHRNGKAASPNQFKTLPVVLFAPEAILLLKDSPQARREYIDDLISQCSPAYVPILRRYKKALQQRNRILSDEMLSLSEKRKQSELWEIPLHEEGKILVRERRRWLEIYNRFLEKHYDQIAGQPTRADLFYEPNAEENLFTDKQSEAREEELARGLSLVGPHRDHLTGRLGEKPIRHFGSQGEQRTFTLAMKLAEIQLLEETLQFSPILLLDDILSELDPSRSRFFFEYLKEFKGQVFVTATHRELFPESVFQDYLG